MKDKIAVIIVDYNSEKYLRRCLESLEALERNDLAYVIIDNGNSIEVDQFVSDFPNAVVLKPGSNLGFGGGCNLGMRYALDAAASYLLLLNPDTRAEMDFIAPLLDAMSNEPALGMVGPKIFTDTPERDTYFSGGSLNWWIGRPSNVRDERFHGIRPYAKVPFMTGCAMLLRPEAVRQVGLMSDIYFLYFEDADYAQAFMHARWEIGFVGDAELLHAVSGTTGYHSPLYVYYFSRNRILFMKRWSRWHHYVAFTLFNTLVKLPVAIMYFGVVHRRSDLAAAFIRGYWDGLAGSGKET